VTISAGLYFLEPFLHTLWLDKKGDKGSVRWEWSWHIKNKNPFAARKEALFFEMIRQLLTYTSSQESE
jgi:hypothetical protein